MTYPHKISLMQKLRMTAREGKLADQTPEQQQSQRIFIELTQAITVFVQKCQLLVNQRFAGERLELDKPGRRFVRVVSRWDGQGTNARVYCFIELATGNVYRPKTWKQPELNFIRGTIFQEDPSEFMTEHGPKYMK